MEAQKSQKGADDIIMKRKIYQQLLDWKEKRNGEVALLVEGARRIGKSYIVEEFAKNEYESYILIDFNKQIDKVDSFFIIRKKGYTSTVISYTRSIVSINSL